MRLQLSLALVICCVCSAIGPKVSADDFVRNLGASDLTTTPAPTVSPSAATFTAESSTTISGDPAAAMVAFGHRRHCCGYGVGFPALYNAYTTYQPAYYPRTYTGYYGAYGVGNYNQYNYLTPNPYGYYPNGWIWGSSGPTYTRPFPVWGSPSGIYDFRYLGWGSYGWGGWGGTGPAGWGYQGGFYW